MVRAGIFIGVDRTGNLHALKDAAAGARRMRDWAVHKGTIAEADAKLITDADGGKVRPEQIYDAIKEIIDGPGVDQLIVYYAGHGVNINRGEMWLLSDAPERASAAVNVRGSVELARYCGIPHVVLFSDACRVAPEGIQAQSVTGQEIFPNNGAGDRAKPVDQFFACLLGKTAAEIQDPTTAVDHYTALYTEELIATLSGDRGTALETAAGDSMRYVRPRALERHLETAIPQIVNARDLAAKVNQNPDAIITSDDHWLVRFDLPREPPRMGGAAPAAPPSESESESAPAPPAPSPSPAGPPTSLRGLSSTLFRSAVGQRPDDFDEQLRLATAAPVASVGQMARGIERIAQPFGPDHFETQCGIKVRGPRIVEALASRATVELFRDTGSVVRVDRTDGAAASVLLRFENGTGTVIPAIPDFIAALTFDDDELVDVAYEPSANTGRWDLYKERVAELRALRAVAASASQHGRFRLDREDAEETARKMQYAKGLDPTLAIYAAYAYHDNGLQPVERISQMINWLGNDIGAIFFDLALLGRKLLDKPVLPDDRIVPFTPLLSQGWALLRANRMQLHPALAGIESTVRESLWSLYDAQGVDMLAHALQTREVR